MATRQNRTSYGSGGSARQGRAGSSGRGVRMPQTNPRRTRASSAASRGDSYRSRPGQSSSYGRARSAPRPQSAGLRSVRVGDVGYAGSAGMQSSYRTYMQKFAKAGIVLAVIAVLAFAVYQSPLFPITNVTVTGVEHITASELTELAAVPVDSTLLRVDASGIRSRLLSNAWVEDVSVNRILPGTLELAITEREIAAVVSVSSSGADATEQWAIASDGVWLMNIPEQGSEESANVSSQVYADAESALKITNVPYGVSPQVGYACTDESVLNALSIVDGMTTSLKDRVKSVNASGTDNTVLTLDDGVQIAFGDSSDIRDKERVCLQLLEENEGKVAYINVRDPSQPTWRSL